MIMARTFLTSAEIRGAFRNLSTLESMSGERKEVDRDNWGLYGRSEGVPELGGPQIGWVLICSINMIVERAKTLPYDYEPDQVFFYYAFGKLVRDLEWTVINTSSETTIYLPSAGQQVLQAKKDGVCH